MRKILCFLFLLSTYFGLAKQLELSPGVQISILTIGPGEALNDSFGHSAIRIKDERFDYVFNYGVFDFDEPGFYTEFAQGKLNYKLGINQFDSFLDNYIFQNRWIKEQVLNLTINEQKRIFEFLMNNAKPENKYYLYDFFFDNCATKPRDVIQNGLTEPMNLIEPDNFEAKSFRKLIHSHVKQNSWGSLGIDVALGSVIDKKATAKEHMFLPIYVFEFFEKATKQDGSKLVSNSTVLFQNEERQKKSNFLISPLMIFGILALLIIWVTYSDFKRGMRRKWLDISIFIVTGAIGVGLFLLWFATDHTATAFNYNLLWAFALNLFVVGQLFKTVVKKWFINYLKFLVILLSLLTLHWFIGVQVFAIGLIPFLIALLVRYLFLIKILGTSNPN
jgi:predicted nucleic acid-binding Zn ribbon protein